MYAGELSANEPLRKAVAQLAASGAPVAAECAGLLYLCRELDGQPMCGVLDASARMTERLTLGYRDAVAVGDSVLAPAGSRMRGARIPPHGRRAGRGDGSRVGRHGSGAAGRRFRTAGRARELSAHALGVRARCGPSVRGEVPDVMSSRLVGGRGRPR
ncbi:hypothetical protein GCM10020256_60550 [Streptomyces thermocoprophilus]